MQVKSGAECSKGEHSATLLTFNKLPFIIKIFVLSIFEWLFYTGFTVLHRRFFLNFFTHNKPYFLNDQVRLRYFYRGSPS